MTEESSELYWRTWGQQLKERTQTPFHHPSFVLYFLVAVVLVGGTGIWLEVHKYALPASSALSASALDPLRTALLTFFPALAGSSCMQMILAEQSKAMRATAVCLLAGLLALALCAFPSTVSDGWAVAIGIAGSLVALWTWWIANALQPDFQDNDFDAPVGKSDPNAPLSGSLDGFEA